MAGEIAQTAILLDGTEDAGDRAWLLDNAARDFDLRMTFDAGRHIAAIRHVNVLGPMDDDLAIAMQERVGRPYTMDWRSDPTSVLIDVQMEQGRCCMWRRRASAFTPA